MRTTRLFFSDSLTSNNNPVITLDADASRYLCKVMRYKEGDQVVLFNGDGNDYTATLVSAGKAAQLQVESSCGNPTESPLKITLVQALAKGTKLDLVIQKATELGVSHITPVNTEHSVLQIDQKRSVRKLDHWKKVASSACAQCNRSVVPTIDPVTDLAQWFKDHENEYSVLIDPLAKQSFKDLGQQPTMNILVGPEGGFSKNELALAADTNVNTVRLGPRVLRTETAGFAAIAIAQSHIGDMS